MCHEEAKEFYGILYDALNESINFPTARDDGEAGTNEV